MPRQPSRAEILWTDLGRLSNSVSCFLSGEAIVFRSSVPIKRIQSAEWGTGLELLFRRLRGGSASNAGWDLDHRVSVGRAWLILQRVRCSPAARTMPRG